MKTASLFLWYNKTLVTFYILLNIASTDVNAQQEITILIPNFPPYTQKVNQQASGIGIDLANAIFKQIGIKVHYRILPNYAKVLHELEQARGDAFLLASQNDERDKIAVFTEPLLINRWCWFVLNNAELTPMHKDFKKKAKVSSYFHSNTHKWLMNNHYDVAPVMENTKLPAMLIRSRIDAVFIA